MIEGVTFDWWHTIAETPWPDYDERMRTLRMEAVREALGSEGLVLEIEALYQAYDAHTDLLKSNWRTHVDLTAEEQIAAFLRLAGIEDVPEVRSAVGEAFGQAIRAKPPMLYPHILATVARLREEGYRVGLISNTGRTWGRYLRPIQDELGVGRHLEVRVFSDEVRARKPRKEIFEEALRLIGLPANRVVHVGDDVDADVAGAKAKGMRAVWFNTGFWPDARTDLADAQIREHAGLFEVLARWKA